MPRRAFLHVGMPKCATTTIQAALVQRQEALRGLGIAYEMPEGPEAEGQGNAARLAISILRQREEATAAALDFFSSGTGDVVLSSEAFSALYKSAAVIQFIEALRARGFEVSVIALFRRQDHWLESDFKQHVKGAHTWDGTIAELLEKRTQQDVLNYALFTLYWGKYVGRDRVFTAVIQPGSARRDPVNFVLEQIGAGSLCYGEDADVPLANVSPPTGLIEPARLLKQEMRAAGASAGQVDVALDRFFAEAPGVIAVPKRRFLMPHAQRQAVVDRWKGSNHDLVRRAGHRGAFDVDVAEDPASEVPLDEEARAVLAAWTAARGPAPAPQVQARRGLLRRLLGK
ncbi:hypothetical protein [Roseovarius mucosus]|uniref:hypothetical protein n=1 Tax=Roseovarius mucosus TaxID=215743 RepID=UPI003F6EE98A